MKKMMKAAAMLVALIAMLSFSFTAIAETSEVKAQSGIETKAAKKNKKNKKNKKAKKAKKAAKAELVENAVELDENAEITETIEDEKTPLAGLNLSIVLKIKNKGAIKLGDTLKIEAKLSGFDGIDYSLQWQKSTNGTDWEDVEGQTGKNLKVVLTTENAACAWRVAAIAA